jgi:hypothetical protein
MKIKAEEKSKEITLPRVKRLNSLKFLELRDSTRNSNADLTVETLQQKTEHFYLYKLHLTFFKTLTLHYCHAACFTIFMNINHM